MRMGFSVHTVITKAAEMRVLSRGLKKVTDTEDCVVAVT
jgi:hypothetical protein